MKNLRFFIAVFIFLSCTIIHAQEVVITGTVIDEDGQTMVGLNVLIENQPTLGASTDFDGKYELRLPAGEYSLVFKYLGYEDQKHTVSSS